MKRRIGIVLADMPRYSETFLLIKFKALKELEYDVTLFLDKKNNDKTFDEIPIVGLPRLNQGVFINIFTLVREILICATIVPGRTIRFIWFSLRQGINVKSIVLNLFKSSRLLRSNLDWIHFGFGTLGLGRELVGIVTGSKLAVSFRGFDLMVFPNNRIGVYDKLFSHLDKAHFISKSLWMKAESLGFAGKYELIIPGTELSISDLGDWPRNLSRAEIHMVTTARLHWIKGLDYSIQAIYKLILEHNLRIKYTIIGGGEELERLKYLTYLYQIEEFVEFVGVKSRLETQHLLNSADIYLQYSLSEGYCNSLVEAQGKGLVCVASRVGGLIENLENGFSGYLVDGMNPDKLVETLLKIIKTDKSNIQEIRKRAVTNALTKFDFKVHKDSWESFYSES